MTPGGGAASPPPAPAPSRLVHDDPSTADRTFNLVTMAAGISVLVLLTLVGFFLIVQSSTRDQRDRPLAVPDPHRVRTGPTRRRSACSACSPAPCWSPSPPSPSPCRWACWPPWPSPSTPAPAPASGSPASSICSPRCRRCCSASGASCSCSDKIIPISKWLTDHLGVHPVLQDRRGRPLHRLDLHRRHRGVADGAADHHRHRPRGVLPDAAGREGGGARPGRHPVGDDPHRRAPLRPGRHHRRLDAGPRPGPRRDHRRGAAAARRCRR